MESQTRMRWIRHRWRQKWRSVGARDSARQINGDIHNHGPVETREITNVYNININIPANSTATHITFHLSIGGAGDGGEVHIPPGGNMSERYIRFEYAEYHRYCYWYRISMSSRRRQMSTGVLLHAKEVPSRTEEAQKLS